MFVSASLGCDAPAPPIHHRCAHKQSDTAPPPLSHKHQKKIIHHKVTLLTPSLTPRPHDATKRLTGTRPPTNGAWLLGKGGSVRSGALLGGSPPAQAPKHHPQKSLLPKVSKKLVRAASKRVDHQHAACGSFRGRGTTPSSPTDRRPPPFHAPTETGAITGPGSGLERPAAGEGHRDTTGGGVELSGASGSGRRMYAPMQRVRRRAGAKGKTCLLPWGEF